MSTAIMPTAIAPPPPYTIPISSIRRLSVDEYHAMIANEILKSSDRVELINGYLVEKMTFNPPHRSAVKLVRDALNRILTTGWYEDSQGPFELATSQPEPDVMLVRGQVRDHFHRHARPDEIGLLIEVADTSLAFDQRLKLRIYAEASIPVYWIVNIPDNRIEVYTLPQGTGDDALYVQQQSYTPTQDIPVVLDGVEIGRLRVADLLPR